MKTENAKTAAPVDRLVGPDAVLYSTLEVGRLIRWLNELCVKAVRSGDATGAKSVASLSSGIEEALRMYEANRQVVVSCRGCAVTLYDDAARDGVCSDCADRGLRGPTT